MKSKSIFLMAVSLGFGLVAAVGITQVMGRNKTEPKAEVPKQPVLVAINDLDINTELTAEMFKEEQWPAEYVPEGVVTSVEEIEGKVCTSRVGKNGTVFLANLVNKWDFRDKKIPAGFKVYGVTLGSADHLYGLLEPGDLVDLIAVFRNNRTTGPSSQTFLRKVRVFNIGSSTSKDPEGRSGVKGNIVVGLLVTEKQSEKIALVNKVADLNLAMRSGEDTEEDLTSTSGGTSLGDLLGTGESASTSGADGLAAMLAHSFASNLSDGASTEESEETELFTMIVYSSEGPTTYRFDKKAGSVPQRVEGFGGQTPPPAAEAVTPAAPATPATEDPTGFDLEGIEADADSDLLIDELDSEPGA
jgi:Flp pilus assembly protein CpaB